MKKWIFYSMMCAAATSMAADNPGIPRDSNFNNTGWYDATRVHAQLQIFVDQNTDVVHFIRDNNDPRVVTKAYLLKHVDAYEFRQFIRQMVQSKRVGNTSLVENYPANTTGPSANTQEATTSSATPNTPVNAQPSYNPATQLGSNTAVECLKYVDGTGLLIVSAEEYRFKDNENGMGIDSLVEFLDRPQMGANFGYQTFFYLPKYVPAFNLLPLIQNVGMNVTDVSELWQGQDLVAYDPALNWLIFYVSNYSCDNISRMLAKYDVPIPQLRLTITVYEMNVENDDKIGFDFQNWKNNEGTDFFSVGGRYRNNWSAIYTGGMNRNFGSERTSYFNFNPKWNTRYLDFMVSKGNATVSQTGELVIRNNTSATLSKTTQIMYVDVSNPVPAATVPGNGNTDYGVGAYELLSALIGESITPNDLPIGKGQAQKALPFTGFGFTMNVTNASVNLEEASFTVALTNNSLLGFNSNGTPRIGNNNMVTQTISLPYGSEGFIIGGLKKKNTVVSSDGIPWLKDLPWVGYLFSTKSTSSKDCEVIVVANCQWEAPAENPGVAITRTYKRNQFSNNNN